MSEFRTQTYSASRADVSFESPAVVMYKSGDTWYSLDRITGVRVSKRTGVMTFMRGTSGVKSLHVAGAKGVTARHPKAKRIAVDFKVFIDGREDFRVVPFWQGVEFLIEAHEIIEQA